MGQQHKKITKRRRRSNYLKRKKEELSAGVKSKTKTRPPATKKAVTQPAETKKKTEPRSEG